MPSNTAVIHCVSAPVFEMDAIRSVSSAFNLPLSHFCFYAACLLLILHLLKSTPRSIPSKSDLLDRIASSSTVYGRAAAAMLQPSADHRQHMRSSNAWQKVEQVERDLGHVQQQPSAASAAPGSDFMLPSKIVTRHLHVALTSDSDTFNLYTVQHNLLVGCIQWLSSPSQASHYDVAARASQVPGELSRAFLL